MIAVFVEKGDIKMEFTLDAEQTAKAVKWMEKKARYSGAAGGQFSFIFTPTSFGVAAKVTDGEDELDLTDISKW